MTAPRLSSEGDAPAGVKAFFVNSYVAKYLPIHIGFNKPRETLLVLLTLRFQDHPVLGWLPFLGKYYEYLPLCKDLL